MPTVLIVDDEPVIVRVLARFLEAPGRTLLTAASAAEGLELARRGPIDVALLDKNLGDRSGLELARDLRRLDPMTAVILVTGYASFESAVEAVQIGAYDYVTKPVADFEGLGLKVANAVEKVRLEREHARISAQLTESEGRYRELFEAVPDGLVVVDVASAQVCEANAAAAAMFRRDRAELVGSDASALFREPLPALHASPDGALRVECARADGTSFPAELTAGEGRLRGRATRTLTVRDVSARERLLSERRAVEEELRHAQKMDAVGRVAGGIAHDLGNVLAVVLSCVEHMAACCDVSAREDLEAMELAVDRGSKLVRQMMTLTRKAPSSPVVLSVTTALVEMTRLLARSVGDRVSLVVDAPSDAWSVRIDPTQLSQVLLNLAVNARDAMPDGGTLRVAVENRPADAGRAGGVRDEVVLTVSDTGVGMTPEVRERVFEPFFTTKERGKGTGLGLAVTYGIIHNAGGTICVDSAPGRGTTLRIVLPRAHEDAPADAPAVAPAPSAEAGPRTVLVVEDVAALRAAMGRALAASGLHVLDAGSAEDALRALQEVGRSVDLLVTDLILPGMAGTELADELRRMKPGCPVLLVTGSPADARVGAFARDGGRVLLKPFAHAALVEEAKRLVGAAT